MEGFALTAVPPVSAPTVIDESVTPLLGLVTPLTSQGLTAPPAARDGIDPVK